MMEKPPPPVGATTETPEETAAYWEWWRSLSWREKYDERGLAGVLWYTRAGSVLVFGALALFVLLTILLG